MSNEYLEDKNPLNLAQYSTMDFTTYFDSLLARIKVQYQDEYDDFGQTALGVMIPHTFAYGLSQLSWMLDRRISGLYFETSESRHELTRLANTNGYKVNPATSSSCTIKNECESTVALAIMSKGFIYSGTDGLLFETVTDYSIPAGTTVFYTDVREVESRELHFSSDGSINQRYALSGSSEEDKVWIARNSITVYINGLEWTEQQFLTLEKTNQYEISYTEDPPVLKFGDGIVGNVPISGADIVILYSLTHGASGNINSNNITNAESEFLVAGNPVDLTVTNESNTSGGEDPESIRSIKKQAPLYIFARGACVTSSDYDTHINNFADPMYGSVAKGYAIIVRNVANDLDTMLYVDNITDATQIIKNNGQINYDEIINDTNSTTGIIKQNELITEQTTEIINQLTLMGTVNTNLDTQNKEIIHNVKIINSVISMVSDLASDIITLNGGSVPQIHLDATAIKDYVNTQITTSSNSIESAYTQISGEIEDNKTILTNIVTATAGVVWFKNIINDFAENIVTSINSLMTTINEQYSVINTNANNLLAHLDVLFDKDCKSNLVVVPILTTDSDGFYTSPSTGLIRALKAYLDEIKEVSQFVQVTNGANWLVSADIDIDVKLLPSVIVQEKQSEISRIIDGMLKGRDFAESLYLQHIYNELKTVSGVGYLNVNIIDPVDKIDEDGNLIIEEREIVTKGTVTINFL